MSHLFCKCEILNTRNDRTPSLVTPTVGGVCLFEAKVSSLGSD